MRVLVLGGLLLAGLVAVIVRPHDASTTAAARPPAVVVRAGYYGVNAQLAFDARASAQWARSAAQIARLGVGTVRRDAFWSAIEPSPPRGGRHRYHWHATDRLVAALAASRLRWYPLVDYGTPWAGDGWKAPPTAAHVGDYAAFAGALARRYGRRGSFWRRHPRLPVVPVHDWEIWNEPNVPRFWADQAGAPARLASMYLAARARIDAVDPGARVVLGGLGAIGVDGFLTRMVAARPDLVGQLDAVGFHPYGGGDHAGLRVTYERLRLLRSSLDRLFPSAEVPIEITETGWAVPPVPESWRARRLRRLALELPRSDCDVARFIVHTWTSARAGSSPEAWFGIAHANGTLTPSGAALRAAIATMRTPERAPRGTVRICR